jgi:hypothetical protein
MSDKKRKNKLSEERKIQEEKNNLNNKNLLYDELQKLRDELGGPFFTKEENNKY